MSGNLNNETTEETTVTDESNTSEKVNPLEELKSFFATEFEKVKTELRTEQTKALNGFDKKLKNQTKVQPVVKTSSPTTVTLEAEDSTTEDSADPYQLTVDALKAGFQTELENTKKALQAEIEKRDKEQAEKDKKAFHSDINKSVALTLAGFGFDDIKEATKVFFAYHDINYFADGVDDEKIYKTSKSDAGKTLSTLVEEWKNSTTGKRFLKAENLVDGAGIEESKKPPKAEEPKPVGQLTAKELSEGLQSGQIKLKIK